MKITNFLFDKKKTQFFLTTNHSNTPLHKSIDKILVDHTPSLVGKLNDSGLIIKFIRARSWHEYLKLLWNHSRVTKEVKGNKILQELGLRVPEIHEVGYGVIPSIKHQFLGYYVMEDLHSVGFQELSTLIQENAIEGHMRETIMLAIYNGLKSMRDNRIVFSDFHLDNVFANKKGEITWIDAGVTTYSHFNRKRFCQKHNHAITRYINYIYNGQQLLTQSEKALFNHLLLSLIEN
jgi:hypothetical protein